MSKPCGMDEELKREIDRYNFTVEDAKRYFGEWDMCDPVVWAILRVVQAQNDLAHAINEVASCGAPERMLEAAIAERRALCGRRSNMSPEDSSEPASAETLTSPIKMSSTVRPHLTRKTFTKTPVWVKGLNGRWLDAVAVRYGNGIAVEPNEIIEGGMSGSPILDQRHSAIAIFSSNLTNPVLFDALPAWLVRSLVRTNASRPRDNS